MTLVERIRRVDAEMDRQRRSLVDVADRRAALVRELVGQVGGTEAARLLGVTRSAVYKAFRRS
jgi:hypothetical protein